jgi:methyl acetate hydrolase
MSQRAMSRNPNRREVLKATAAAAAAAAGATPAGRVARAGVGAPPRPRPDKLNQIDAVLRAAVAAGDVPGVVALAATEDGLVYQGVFGSRRLDGGPAMTTDTVFRIASMVKLITTVAALRLVEQEKLALDAPVPAIDPAIGAPLVLEGFDAAGKPQLRPARRSILLRHLLTHTAGFAYRLWDAKALRYFEARGRMRAAARAKLPPTPLMFDPGARWQYGTSIDWVGRIVEAIGGEPLDLHFRRHILDPLGMHDTGFVIAPEQRAREASVHRRKISGALAAEPMERPPPLRARPRSFSGGGGIYSTATDYLTFLRMLLHGGSLGGTRILRPDTVALMGRNQIGAIEIGTMRTTAPALSNDVDFFPGSSCKWGFGHLINTQPVAGGRSAGSLTWGGLFNTYYWIDPQQRIVAVFMTQVLPFADGPALRAYRAFERGLYAAVRAG